MIKLGVIVLCAGAYVSAAHAEDLSPEQKAVEVRQSLFHLLEWNYAPTIGAMLKNKMEYDPTLVRKNATRLEALAQMIPDAFAVDTREVTGVKTRARGAIWATMADFKAKSEDLAKAAAKLSEVTQSGDEKAFRQAAVAVGKACGACHDDFREK